MYKIRGFCKRVVDYRIQKGCFSTEERLCSQSRCICAVIRGVMALVGSMRKGIGNIGIFKIGGFIAKKGTLLFSGGSGLFVGSVLYLFSFFVFPQDGYFFSKIWSILKKNTWHFI